MKWIAEIFVVVLCLVAGGLYVSGQKKDAHIQRLNAAMEVHNELLRINNQALAYEMAEDVRDEILNMAKMENKGLLDTLKYLNVQRDQLLANPSLSASDAWNHISRMKEMHDRQLRSDTGRMPAILLDSLQSITHPERVMELLMTEHVLLNLMNNQLSVSYPFSIRLSISGVPIAEKILAGDSLRVWIQLPVGYGMDRDVYPKIRFDASSGTITHNPGESHAILTMPTDQVLLPGQQAAWLNYSATVMIPKVTGGYERIPVEGKVRVVRKWPGG